jgi:single-strand DNA-binding protein
MSAANVNVVVITGNLTQEPELRYLGSGTAVCEMRVAVNGRRKVGEEWVDKPNYFNVTVFGGHGEACAKHLSKGSPAAIEGRLDWSEWEAKDGSGKRQGVKIIANTVQFGPKRAEAAPGSSETAAENNGQAEIAASAELPAEPEPAPKTEEEEEIPF